MKKTQLKSTISQILTLIHKNYADLQFRQNLQIPLHQQKICFS